MKDLKNYTEKEKVRLFNINWEKAKNESNDTPKFVAEYVRYFTPDESWSSLMKKERKLVRKISRQLDREKREKAEADNITGMPITNIDSPYNV